MCSLHLTHPSGAVDSLHCSAREAVGGVGALLKGLTSVVDTSCQSWDSNPQPWVTSGFKSNALSIRPRLHCLNNICAIKSMILLEMKIPQLSMPQATAAMNQNSFGDRMEKKPWEKPGSVGGAVPL